jgi:hypothetical protein
MHAICGSPEQRSSRPKISFASPVNAGFGRAPGAGGGPAPGATAACVASRSELRQRGDRRGDPLARGAAVDVEAPAECGP